MKKPLITISLVLSASTFAHSGGTDSSGCHNDRQRGGYHCHKSDGTMITDQKAREPASNIEKDEEPKKEIKKEFENK